MELTITYLNFLIILSFYIFNNKKSLIKLYCIKYMAGVIKKKKGKLNKTMLFYLSFHCQTFLFNSIAL